jgi:hypothetical protein
VSSFLLAKAWSKLNTGVSTQIREREKVPDPKGNVAYVHRMATFGSRSIDVDNSKLDKTRNKGMY